VRRTRRYVASLVVVVLLTAFSLAAVLFLNARPKLGLDLQGGLSVVLTATGRTDPGVLDQTVEIIRNRVDSLGAQEPEISRSGNENIIVQLPGISDPDRALEIIGKTAQLRFREVIDTASAPEVAEDEQWKVTEDDPVEDEVVFPSTDGRLVYRLGPAEVQGSHVDDAFPQFDQAQQGWLVVLNLTGEGRTAFAEVTQRMAAEQKQLAIVLDQTVESAPVVQQPITDGRAQITGRFTDQESRDLALVLKTGALPIELEQSQVQRVSATLGTAALRSGLIAGFIGLGLVALFMLALYRFLGVIILIGLGLFAALILGVIGAISVTRGFSLTLAGVAGLIVSVGIAADSYIIYFERVKDELKEGKTFRSAVDRAFSSALRTNFAANGVAAAAALILYAVAIGPVRGFALMLGISVLLDIALLYFYAHPAVALLARNRRLAGLRSVGMREAAPEARIAGP
jgi:preprotein translocase subunit SecD